MGSLMTPDHVVITSEILYPERPTGLTTPQYSSVPGTADTSHLQESLARSRGLCMDSGLPAVPQALRLHGPEITPI